MKTVSRCAGYRTHEFRSKRPAMSITSYVSSIHSPVTSGHADLDRPAAPDRLLGRLHDLGRTVVAQNAFDEAGQVGAQLAGAAWASLVYLVSPQARKDAVVGTQQVINAVTRYYPAASQWSAKEFRDFTIFYGNTLRANGYAGPLGNTGIDTARLTRSEIRALEQMTFRAAREFDLRIRTRAVNGGANTGESPQPANNIVPFATGKGRSEVPRSCSIEPPRIGKLPGNGGYSFIGTITGSPENKVSHVGGTMRVTVSPSNQTVARRQGADRSWVNIFVPVTPMPTPAPTGGKISVGGECYFKDGRPIIVQQTFPFNPPASPRN